MALLFLSCNANSPENKFLLAERLLEDKKYDAAIDEFQDIVNRSPNTSAGINAQLKIAQIQHLYLGKEAEAVESYKLFLKHTKDEKLKLEVEKILADIQFQNLENYDEAIQAYINLVKSNPHSENAEELLYKLGRSLFLRSKFEDAIKVFEYQKTKFQQGRLFWKAELEIGNSLSSQQKCTDAIKQYDKVIKSLEASKEIKILASFAKASCYEEKDELDDAYELFSQIRDEYPAPAVVDLKLKKIKRRKILRKR